MFGPLLHGLAAVALHQHLLCFSKSNSRKRTRSWLSYNYSAILLHSQKEAHFSFISCCSSSSSSSTPQTPETDTGTAESCVNLGLQLFSKGRVKDALTQFETALSLDPNPMEAQAAL